jgi:hypothetical protein
MYDAINQVIRLARQHDPATGYYKSVDPYEALKILLPAATAASGIHFSEQMIKGYAIKCQQGYFATQGREYWFQDKPNGWALFCSEDDARNVVEPHHSAIGTATEAGYAIETVYA